MVIHGNKRTKSNQFPKPETVVLSSLSLVNTLTLHSEFWKVSLLTNADDLSLNTASKLNKLLGDVDA